MENKYKILVNDTENSNEPVQMECSVGDEIVKKLDGILKTLNNDTTTISPLTIDSNDLSVRWGVIETINDRKVLKYYISLTNKQ